MRIAPFCFPIAIAFVAACAPPPTRGNQAPSPSARASESRGGSSLTSRERVIHALDRLTFGPRPGDEARVQAMGLDRWIDAQLSPERIRDDNVLRVLDELETQRKSPRELLADHLTPQEVLGRIYQQRSNGHGVVMTSADSQLVRRTNLRYSQLNSEITAATLVRAVGSERQLLEVMTEFWENHFNVYAGKAPNQYALAAYDRDVIRPHALGRFRDLLEAVAKSPEMLYYLDNWQSVVDSLHPNGLEYAIETRREASDDPDVRAFAELPQRRGTRGVNENYARELMELHTLGVDGGYTQRDVQEVARAFTGWTIDAPQYGGSFVFRPELHDAGPKTVFGHALPGGRGIEDGEEVLDILATSPATARFIVTKLARHFVSDDPPSDLIDRCATTFTRTGGDIRQTLRCIIKSPEFFSRAAYRAKVKTPFELVASALRALNAPIDTTGRYASLVAQLGQPIYGHLTPEGWPDAGDAWMNTGAILNRINLGLRLAGDQIPGVRLASWQYAASLEALPPQAQVDAVIDDLLGGDASAETRRILMTGENPLLARGKAGYEVQAGHAAGQRSALAALVGLALGSPEFQRR